MPIPRVPVTGLDPVAVPRHDDTRDDTRHNGTELVS
jgi:hypothetical protein